MRSRNKIQAAVLMGGLLLGLSGQAIPVRAALPVNDHRSLAAVRNTMDQGNILTKPHGWIRFDEVCAFGSNFSVTLDRAKRSSGRVIVRDFKAMTGNLYRQALPSALGLGCMPYSTGFD